MKNLITFSLCALILSACGDDQEENKTANTGPAQVEVFELHSSEVSRNIEVPGSVIPSEQIILYSEVSGRISQILFKEGQRVSKGQVLLKVDTDILQAQRKQLSVDLSLAEKDEQRKKALLSGKAISLEVYEQSSSALASIQAQIDLLNTQISKAAIRAPFSGIVGLRQVSDGAFITSSTPIASLVQVDPLKIEFSIAEIYAGLIKTDQQITFNRERDSTQYTANVYAFEPSVDENSRMLLVRAQMKNNNNLIPGSFVKVKLDLGNEQNAFMIPTESIIPVMKGQKVYVIREGKVAEVMVQTGIRTADRIQVSGDLKEGEQILVSGLLAVRPGMPVAVKKTVQK